MTTYFLFTRFGKQVQVAEEYLEDVPQLLSDPDLIVQESEEKIPQIPTVDDYNLTGWTPSQAAIFVAVLSSYDLEYCTGSTMRDLLQDESQDPMMGVS